MSEHLPPESLGIPRVDHEACIAINGVMRAFSSADSAIWVYPEQYRMFNNVIKEHTDGSYEQWFGLEDDDIDTLHEAGITMVTPPYPTDTIISRWWKVEMADFDNEMAYIEETGELPKN